MAFDQIPLHEIQRGWVLGWVVGVAHSFGSIVGVVGAKQSVVVVVDVVVVVVDAGENAHAARGEVHPGSNGKACQMSVVVLVAAVAVVVVVAVVSSNIRVSLFL